MNLRSLDDFKCLSIALFFCFTIVGNVAAQTGSISGTVIDVDNNDVLSGVNVGLLNTQLGDATSENGQFSIDNVPEGTYTIRASLVGYKTVEQDIEVESEKTAEVEIALSEKAVELGSINVVDQRSGYMISEVSSVTKIGVPLLETPQSVSVITGQQLANQNVENLGEALRYSSGVQGETFGFEPRTTFVRFRGFEATTSGIYRDGLQLRNPNFIVGYNPEPYAAERIEIPKGPSSVLYGSGNPGGLVNFVSKKPTQEPFGELKAEVGSFNRYQGQLDFGGPIDEDGTFSYRLTGLARESDTQVDYINNDRLYLAPAFSWNPTDKTSLTVLARYQQDDTRSSQRLPEDGTLEQNPNGEIPVDRFTGEPDVDKYDRNQHSVGYQFEHENGPWTFSQNARYYDIGLDDITVYGTAFRSDNRTMDRALYESFGELTGLAIDNQAQLDLETGVLAQKILVGLDYQNVDAETDQNFGAATPIDIYDPEYGAELPEPDPLADSKTHQRQTGVYLQDQLTFNESLILTLNGRYDWAQTETSDYLADSEMDQRDEAFTGRVGLSYRFGFGLAPYASYSESFSPAIGTDQSGDQFDPETGQQFEIGAKFEPENKGSYVTLALFDLTRQNFLQTDPETFAQVQTGEANSQGIELEAVSGFDFGLNLKASFTYQDVEITESAIESEIGNRPVQVRKTMGSLWADYTVQSGTLDGLGISGGVRHLGPMYGDLANTLKISAVTVGDAAVFYDWDKFRFQVNVDNIFNNKYVASGFTSGDQNFGTYGAVRSLQASLRYRW